MAHISLMCDDIHDKSLQRKKLAVVHHTNSTTNKMMEVFHLPSTLMYPPKIPWIGEVSWLRKSKLYINKTQNFHLVTQKIH